MQNRMERGALGIMEWFFLISLTMNLFLAAYSYGCYEKTGSVDMDMGYEGNKKYEMLRKALEAGSGADANKVAEEMNEKKR